MRGRNHRKLHPAQIDRSALVETDRVEMLVLVPIGHQVILAHDRHAQFARQRQHVGHVVEMRMGQDQVGGARDGSVVALFGQDRVAGEPWVDQQHLVSGFDAKGSVAKPR